MTRSLRALAVSGLVWLVPGEAAVAAEPFKPADARMAQFKSDTPIRLVPARPATPDQPAISGQPAASNEPPRPRIIGTTKATSIGGLGLRLEASRMEDDQLVRIMAWVADSLNLMCSKVEVLGWPGVSPYTSEGEERFMAVDRAFKVEGYTYAMRDLPPPAVPELAKIQADITAYSGEPTDRYAPDKHIVTVWYKVSNDLHVILCRAEPKPPKKEED